MTATKLISISSLTSSYEPTALVGALDPLWRERGYEIAMGGAYDPKADVAILHHNLSCLDPACLPTPPSGVNLVNGRALDIRKRRYSELSLKPGDNWDGQVIVKTDENHFGMPERRQRRRPLLERLRTRLANRNWKLARRLPHRTYPVLDSIDEVPRWVWRDQRYLVERFMPERDGEYFCIRGWLFFGDRGYGYRIFSHDPMAKVETMVDYEYLRDFPESLYRARRKAGVDFGKIDYVMHGDRAIVLDINKTPTFGGDPRSPRLQDLSFGIDEFLK
ncbi:MAG: hypothetical protein AAFR35_07190 [Pseudomonadota bacterium]